MRVVCRSIESTLQDKAQQGERRGKREDGIFQAHERSHVKAAVTTLHWGVLSHNELIDAIESLSQVQY